MLNVQFVKILEGLGFGDGLISGGYLSGARQHDLETLLNSDDLLLPVVSPNGHPMDDGCGDGRPVAPEIATNLRQRPKVLGGGACMTMAALIASGQADNRPLAELFIQAAQTLQDAGLFFGGHADENAEEPDSGCGAIDRAPQIIRACVQYRKEIIQALKVLGIDTQQSKTVFAAFETYAAAIARSQGQYSGRQVVDSLRQQGAEIRQLAGQHAEGCILLNTVPETAINQAAIRALDEQGMQAFTVDVWRLSELAEIFDEPELALFGELVYTLGTAAVLTKGDLPVYVVLQD